MANDDNAPKTRTHRHPLSRLGLLLAAGGSVTSAALASGASLADPDPVQPAHAPQVLLAQLGEGAHEGNGEGEGEGHTASLAQDDAAYLTQLGLIRGHLNVGVDLYRNDHAAVAQTHMKHPGAELYTALKPALAARNAAGFADELEMLAARVEARAPLAEVEAAFATVQKALDAAAASVSARNDPALQFRVVVALMRAAAQEYAIAVVDGRMENAHEYQDALGFTRVAEHLVTAVATAHDDAAPDPVAEAVSVAHRQLEGIQDLWVGLVPPEQLDRDPARLFGATARVELAANAID